MTDRRDPRDRWPALAKLEAAHRHEARDIDWRGAITLLADFYFKGTNFETNYLTVRPSLPATTDEGGEIALVGEGSNPIWFIDVFGTTLRVRNDGPVTAMTVNQDGTVSFPNGISSGLGTLGYVQVTADQATITSEVDLTSLTVTVTAGTSRRIRITGHILVLETDAAAGLVEMKIKESTTQLSTALETINASGWLTHDATAVITPSAGSHTYKLTLAASTTVTMRAGGTFPAFILVEDIGAA